MKGGAFRLNMHPQAYFDGNPYRSDRPLPPAKRTPGKGPDVKPFKPSSPPKAVSTCICDIICIKLVYSAVGKINAKDRILKLLLQY